MNPTSIMLQPYNTFFAVQLEQLQIPQPSLYTQPIYLPMLANSHPILLKAQPISWEAQHPLVTNSSFRLEGTLYFLCRTLPKLLTDTTHIVHLGAAWTPKTTEQSRSTASTFGLFNIPSCLTLQSQSKAS